MPPWSHQIEMRHVASAILFGLLSTVAILATVWLLQGVQEARDVEDATIGSIGRGAFATRTGQSYFSFSSVRYLPAITAALCCAAVIVTAVVLRRRVGWATLGTACLFLLSLTIIGITAHAHFLISSCFQSDPCVVSGLTAAQEDTTRAFLAAVALLVGTLLLFLGVATAYTAPDWDEWGLRYLTRR